MQKKSAPSPELQLTFLVKDAMVSGILKRRNDRDADRTMEKFETSILEQLDRECGGEEIVSIGLRVRIHNQNMTTAAKAQADRNTFGHLS